MRTVFRERPDAVEVRRYREGWRGVLRVWLPVAIAVMVIVIESTGTFSSDNTSGWIRPYFERWFGHINDTVWAVGHHIARKSGHLLGYGLLGLTWLRAWLLVLADRVEWSLGGWRLRCCGLGLVGTFCVAGLDEWHQTFLPNRTGVFSDVLIDCAGALVMFCVVALIWWRGKARTTTDLHG